MYFTSDNFM